MPHVTQKFILAPDPIAFAPWPVLLDPGEPRDICQCTSFRRLFAVLFVTPRNKDDTADGVPTDLLSHNHCDCTDSHCNSHIVLRVCLCFLFVPSPTTSPPAAEAAQRLRRDEEVLDAPEELRQPFVGVGGAQEEQEQGSSLCARRRSRKTVTCHGLRVVEPVYIRDAEAEASDSEPEAHVMLVSRNQRRQQLPMLQRKQP